MKIAKMNIPQVKESAYDVFRYACNKDKRIIDKLVYFYKEGTKNPSVAKIIAKQAIQDGITRYGEYLQDDIQFLRGKPIDLIKEYWKKMTLATTIIDVNSEAYPTKRFYDKFNERFKQLYPQTHNIREKIISEKRVCLNEIKPCLPKGIKKALKYAKYF